MRPSLAGFVLPCFAVFGHAAFAVVAAQEAPAPPAPAAAAQQPKPKSLLIITFDTTRRDFMGFLGRTPSPTPNLDALAAKSAVFTDAYTVAPLTLPAHSSLLTGLYPISHGVHENTAFKLPASAHTLAEILQEHGYATGAAVAAFVLDPMFGVAQGFARYSTPETQGGTEQSFLSERRADQQVAQALADLAVLSKTPPYFYWLHFFDPHFPYAPPHPTPPSQQELLAKDGLARHLYEDELRFADGELGHLLALLERKQLTDDLVIVFAADHGESLGDAPESSHGFFLFDPTVRIPLLIRDPTLPPRRIAAQASLIDVVPTVLDLLGIPATDKFDGVDLAPLLRDPAAEPPDRALLLESWFAWLNYGWSPFDGCVRDQVKYLRSARRELFDRAADPSEQKNLFDPAEPRSLSFVRRLEALLASSAQKLAKDVLQLSATDRQRLEKLGYAVAGSSAEAPPDPASLPDAYAKAPLIKALEEVVRARSENDLPRAVALLRELVTKEPRSASLHEELGTLLYDLGPANQDEAEEHLKTALKIDARRSRAHYAIGLSAARRADAARTAAKAARDAGELEQAKGFVMEERKQARRAAKAFRACLAFEPNFPDCLSRFARFLETEAERAARIDAFDEAAADYKESVELVDRLLAMTPAEAPGRRELADHRERAVARRDELAKAAEAAPKKAPAKDGDGGGRDPKDGKDGDGG